MAVLPDVLGPKLLIVFCGTGVGTRSAQTRSYYARRGNRFWPSLYRTGLTRRVLQPKQFRQLLNFRLGLTDLAKSSIGNDPSLSLNDFDRVALKRKIVRWHPRIVAFTGKCAAEEYLRRKVGYGLMRERLGQTRFFVLPSPSGSASRYWDESRWHELSRVAKKSRWRAA